MVSPVGLAGSTFGRNEPSIEVYRRGFELGINLLFWDPMFKNMTSALLELSGEKRSRLFIYGTIGFGGPKQIRKAFFKRLNILKLEKLSGFTLATISVFRPTDGNWPIIFTGKTCLICSCSVTTPPIGAWRPISSTDWIPKICPPS
jgi:hypothetical protein